MSTRFTAKLKETAWEALQAGINARLVETPGEYDLPSIASNVSFRMSREHGLDYGKVLEYLEARYLDWTE